MSPLGHRIFVTNEQNMQNILILFKKLNHLGEIKKPHVKKLIDVFLLYLYNRSFLVLEVHYERNYYKKSRTIVPYGSIKTCF